MNNNTWNAKSSSSYIWNALNVAKSCFWLGKKARGQRPMYWCIGPSTVHAWTIVLGEAGRLDGLCSCGKRDGCVSCLAKHACATAPTAGATETSTSSTAAGQQHAGTSKLKLRELETSFVAWSRSCQKPWVFPHNSDALLTYSNEKRVIWARLRHYWCQRFIDKSLPSPSVLFEQAKASGNYIDY